jgi:GGDEF domain-containing protein
MNVDAEARNMIDDARLPCTAAALVMTADRALYAAKRAGRAQAKLEDVAAAGGSRVVIAQEAAFAGPPLLV